MKITNEKSRLLAIAFLISLLVNVPKMVMLNSGIARSVSLVGAMDFALPLIYGFCFALLILYVNTYSLFHFLPKMGLFAFLYVACSVVFVQTHWRILGIDERFGVFRLAIISAIFLSF